MPTWQYACLLLLSRTLPASPVFMSGTNVVHLTYDEDAGGAAAAGGAGAAEAGAPEGVADGLRLVGDEGDELSTSGTVLVIPFAVGAGSPRELEGLLG